MRVLVFDDYDEDLEPAREVGISLERVDDKSYIMTLPDKCKVHQDVISKSSLRGSGYVGLPNLQVYVESSDESLSDFVTMGNMVVATSKFEPTQDKESGYDYECKSGVRFFKSDYVTVSNFRLSSENDYACYLEFVDRMIGETISKTETTSKNI